MTEQTGGKVVYKFNIKPTTGNISYICRHSTGGASISKQQVVFTFENGEYKSFEVYEASFGIPTIEINTDEKSKYTVNYDTETMTLTATFPADQWRAINEFQGIVVDLDSNVEHVLKIDSNGKLEGCFEVYSKAVVDEKINAINPKIVSQTVTHDTVPEEEISNYQIGKPVFLSGNVYMHRSNAWIPSSNSPTDCICGVKTSGSYKEYVGVVTNVDIKNNMVEFATHGDFYFTVDNSDKYKIGDTILYDGRILNDDMVINNKMIRMTVGVVSAKINDTTLAVFRD